MGLGGDAALTRPSPAFLQALRLPVRRRATWILDAGVGVPAGLAARCARRTDAAPPRRHRLQKNEVAARANRLVGDHRIARRRGHLMRAVDDTIATATRLHPPAALAPALGNL